MVEREAREPGLYWVRLDRGDDWFVGRFLGGTGGWLLMDEDGRRSAVYAIGPRLQPPDAPAAPAAAAERTVRVRIAVAVDSTGGWLSCGYGSGSDEDKANGALRGAAWLPILHWVEADVPLPPAPATVAGEVVDGE